ncbi:MAG TPA: transcriptional regulator [Candidatus Krumholzibacteria bacterium]|nr:transcriptional regulator [Candidatus Krumholzibacteria bacterium]
MGAARTKPAGAGPGDRDPLSPLIHGRVRLLILSQLARAERPLAFTGLKNALGLTDGTLSVNLSKLEEGGLVTITKGFEGKRPRTLVKLTPAGSAQFGQYVEELKSIVPGLRSP